MELKGLITGSIWSLSSGRLAAETVPLAPELGVPPQGHKLESEVEVQKGNNETNHGDKEHMGVSVMISEKTTISFRGKVKKSNPSKAG